MHPCFTQKNGNSNINVLIGAYYEPSHMKNSGKLVGAYPELYHMGKSLLEPISNPPVLKIVTHCNSTTNLYQSLVSSKTWCSFSLIQFFSQFEYK